MLPFPGKSCGLVIVVWTLEYDCVGMNPSFAAALLWLWAKDLLSLRVHFPICRFSIVTVLT